MVGALQGTGVLLLLSVFFAYVLAPIVCAVRRRVRWGRRRRPISNAAALLLIYFVLFAPVAVGARNGREPVVRWVTVTAPSTVDRLFSGGRIAPLDRAIAESM